MTFVDIETNKKFKVLGGPLNMFETTDIYEKLNENMFLNSRSTPINAYNLMKQEYTYLNPNQPVIPFTHTY
jgi:hypothetical protein